MILHFRQVSAASSPTVAASQQQQGDGRSHLSLGDPSKRARCELSEGTTRSQGVIKEKESEDGDDVKQRKKKMMVMEVDDGGRKEQR
ncbi:hypothetical protein CDL15_Pgr017988 [Punica granatum]|uniref:Uncharacterized protein n=1 Tax=Punica granatum TaxID=22663 RepID=A0A218WH08_PUNGR|nr:hypothetical protein CDL15_Pgr017988 [Punica granatum]